MKLDWRQLQIAIAVVLCFCGVARADFVTLEDLVAGLSEVPEDPFSPPTNVRYSGWELLNFGVSGPDVAAGPDGIFLSSRNIDGLDRQDYFLDDTTFRITGDGELSFVNIVFGFWAEPKSADLLISEIVVRSSCLFGTDGSDDTISLGWRLTHSVYDRPHGTLLGDSDRELGFILGEKIAVGAGTESIAFSSLDRIWLETDIFVFSDSDARAFLEVYSLGFSLEERTIPAPPTLALLGIGLLGMVLVKHRKQELQA